MKNFMALLGRLFVSLKNLFKNLFSSVTRGSSFIVTTIGDGISIIAATGLALLILLFLILMAVVDLFTPGTHGKFIPQAEETC
jgi:hypothetical protein